MFRGINGTPPSTLKLFVGLNVLLIFLTNHEISLLSFQDFLHNNLIIFFNNVHCYFQAINNDSNKLLLYDVNPITRFYTNKKFQRPKNSKFLSKQIPE